jgi:hypothetical protein
MGLAVIPSYTPTIVSQASNGNLPSLIVCGWEGFDHKAGDEKVIF